MGSCGSEPRLAHIANLNSFLVKNWRLPLPQCIPVGISGSVLQHSSYKVSLGSPERPTWYPRKPLGSTPEPLKCSRKPTEHPKCGGSYDKAVREWGGVLGGVGRWWLVPHSCQGFQTGYPEASHRQEGPPRKATRPANEPRQGVSTIVAHVPQEELQMELPSEAAGETAGVSAEEEALTGAKSPSCPGALGKEAHGLPLPV